MKLLGWWREGCAPDGPSYGASYAPLDTSDGTTSSLRRDVERRERVLVGIAAHLEFGALCRRVRHLVAEQRADERRRHVHPRRNAGGGPTVAILDPARLWDPFDRGSVRRRPREGTLVRRGPVALQQPRGGQERRPRARPMSRGRRGRPTRAATRGTRDRPRGDASRRPRARGRCRARPHPRIPSPRRPRRPSSCARDRPADRSVRARRSRRPCRTARADRRRRAARSRRRGRN